MKKNLFQELQPNIEENTLLRIPQRKTYESLVQHMNNKGDKNREVGIVLPVGCGKSGCISLTPFAFNSKRALVVAPNVKIAQQLEQDFLPSNEENFYSKCQVLNDELFPESVEIRGKRTNMDDLEHADVVITNIQQLQRENNRWLDELDADFFDLIIFDEGHHNVASSWVILKENFPEAYIVNFSATPMRADGKNMGGKIIYSYPVSQAIENGFVKKLKATVLNPKKLKYVRREDNEEVEVSLEEVIKLGEKDAGFRKSIVTSTESLNTIVDASIRKLQEHRKETGEKRLKVIASALNIEHCQQIVAAYRERSLRAEYVHSKLDGKTNEQIYQKLENHELDVIVQVRKLGEGFDHPYLSVAAVFSVFNNLSPFVQFVGRIMRVIEQNSPMEPINSGSVVFHAGSNIAKQWTDFQVFSEADQEFFKQMVLPLEEEEIFELEDEIEIEPKLSQLEKSPKFTVTEQEQVSLLEVPLDREEMEALQLLKNKGRSTEEIIEAFGTLDSTSNILKPMQVRRQDKRRATQNKLNDNIKTAVGTLLSTHKLNYRGKDLDKKKKTPRDNFVFLKSEIDKRVNKIVGRTSSQRDKFTLEQLETIFEKFESIIEEVEKEIFDAQN